MLGRQFSKLFKMSSIQPIVNKTATQKEPTRFFNSAGQSARTYDGSPLVKHLIRTDEASKAHYNDYLRAYKQATEYFEKEDYTLAKKKADEALFELTEVNTITAAVMVELNDVRSLLKRSDQKIQESNRRLSF